MQDKATASRSRLGSCPAERFGCLPDQASARRDMLSRSSGLGADHRMAINLKEYVEMRVAAGFCEHLTRTGVALSNLRHNPNDPPDALIDCPEGVCGIEHAAAHYNGREAANISAVLRNTPAKSERWLRPGEDWRVAARRMPVLVNFTDDLISNLQRTLEVHAQKQYGIPTYLVLDATMASLTVADEGPSLAAELVLPPNSTFLAVYLALTTNGTADMEFFQV